MIKMLAHYIVARQLTAHAQWKQNRNTAESIFHMGEENWLCLQGKPFQEKWGNHPCRSTCRPFRLTCTITHANLSARAICRTHEKSYSAEKVLFHRIFFFQSFVFVYERHLWIMQYLSIAYRRRWFRRHRCRPKRKVSFIGLLCVGFQFRFFLELPRLILYTILNVKFLPFV